MNTQTCEFCNRQLHYKTINEGSTVCGKCDAEMEAQWEEAEAKRKAKASKRKCQCCGVGLTPDRHFNCIICIRPLNGGYHQDDSLNSSINDSNDQGV